MIGNILLPLDGSTLAEAGIAPAAAFARSFGAVLTLLHVVERRARAEIHGDRHLTDAREATAYLDDVAARLASSGIRVETHVHAEAIDDVARAILSHASREFDPDLIVMCTHGDASLRNFVFGSLAQRVIASGRTPLLLVHPDGKQERPEFQTVPESPFTIDRLLVPIDSESDHDESLPWAAAIARAFGAEIRLLTVVHTASSLNGDSSAVRTLSPLATSALLEMKGRQAAVHLQEHLDELGATSLKVRAELARGAPAAVIAASVRRHDADAIVLASHGKAGMKAFWSRSVACEVLRRTRKPVFLIPLQGGGSKDGALRPE